MGNDHFDSGGLQGFYNRHLAGYAADQKYKAVGVFTFPVSKPDVLNLNERRYPTKLWENVIRKKMGEVCYALCGHPTTDEGKPKDAFAITHHLRFNENKT